MDQIIIIIIIIIIVIIIIIIITIIIIVIIINIYLFLNFYLVWVIHFDIQLPTNDFISLPSAFLISLSKWTTRPWILHLDWKMFFDSLSLLMWKIMIK